MVGERIVVSGGPLHDSQGTGRQSTERHPVAVHDLPGGVHAQGFVNLVDGGREDDVEPRRQLGVDLRRAVARLRDVHALKPNGLRAAATRGE